jgi:hypothetical protein
MFLLAHEMRYIDEMKHGRCPSTLARQHGELEALVVRETLFSFTRWMEAIVNIEHHYPPRQLLACVL